MAKTLALAAVLLASTCPMGSLAKVDLVVHVGHLGALQKIESYAFSGDGRILAMAGGSSTKIVLWDTATGTEYFSLDSPQMFVSALAIAPDAVWLASVAEGELCLWDLRRPGERRILGGDASVGAIAFGPDGKTLAVGRKGGIELWNPAAEQAQGGARIVADGAEKVSRIAFSPDGALLACVVGDRCSVWAGNLGEKLGEVEIPNLGKTCSELRFPGEHQVALLTEKGLWAWSWKQPDMPSFTALPGCTAVSPDGRQVLATGEDGSTQLWEIGKSGELLKRSFRRALAGVRGHFSPDGRSFLAVNKKALCLCDALTGEVVSRFGSAFASVRSACLTTDGRYLALGVGSRGSLWDLERPLKMGDYYGQTTPVTAVAFHPGDKIMATGEWNGFHEWIVPDQAEIRGRGDNGILGLKALAFSPDGRCMAANSAGGGLRLWTNDPLGNRLGPSLLPDSEGLGYALAFSPDGKTLLGTTDETARLWSLDNGAVLKTLPHAALARAAAYSSGGDRVVTADYEGQVYLWNSLSGELLRKFPTYGRPVTTLAISRDGSKILVGSGIMAPDKMEAGLWDGGTAKELFRMGSHRDWVVFVGFVAGDRVLCTASEDGSVRFWNADDGSELGSLYDLDRGDWLVTTPGGNFDVSSQNALDLFHWRVEGAPFGIIPADTFFTQAYTPGLLGQILARRVPVEPRLEGNALGQPPVVTIESATVNPATRTADLVVRVGMGRDAAGERFEGYDLHVMRDGKLVKRLAAAGSCEDVEMTFDAPWKSRTGLRLSEGDGTKVFRIPGVPLPGHAGQSQVAFTAYAFAEHGHKGGTALRTVILPPAEKQPPRRLHIISIGIDDHSYQPALKLDYAVSDAKLYAEVLSRQLLFSDNFQAGSSVVLTSSSGANQQPVKERIKEALLSATGRGGARSGPHSILPDVDDILFVTYSGHGVIGDDGAFYLIPMDARPGDRTSWISASELSLWLAGGKAEVVVILDTCHSGGALSYQGNFAAGRGLARLAHFEGVRILAGSQMQGTAMESASLAHGVLTYALLVDAPEQSRVSHSVKDMGLVQWFHHALNRVPAFAHEGPQGAKQYRLRNLTPVGGSSSLPQQPLLFDFTPPRHEITVIPGYMLNYIRGAEESLANGRRHLEPGPDRSLEKGIEELENAVNFFRNTSRMDRFSQALGELALANREKGSEEASAQFEHSQLRQAWHLPLSERAAAQLISGKRFAELKMPDQAAVQLGEAAWAYRVINCPEALAECRLLLSQVYEALGESGIAAGYRRAD